MSHPVSPTGTTKQMGYRTGGAGGGSRWRQVMGRPLGPRLPRQLRESGGTVENAMAYELDDLTTPVELVASDDLGMTEIGRETYPVS